MFITGLGTAVPSRRYLQSECWDALRGAEQFSQLSPRSRALLKKVLLGNNGIASRYLALDSLAEAFDIRPDALHARFVQHAPTLATLAAQRALQDTHLTPAHIDGVIISTCTGYLCPGLTSYVAERLGLRADVLALDLVGQGCGAALPNLRAAEALLRADCRQVLSVCVEVCSAAFYLDDDPGVLISACLFGDGAGAAIVSREPSPGRRRVEWKAGGSTLQPASRDLLRFEQRNGMLRNILTPEVPTLAAREAKALYDDLASRVGVEQISTWIWHAGGRDVLLALRDAFALEDEALCWSAAVLRELGNVSSSCVFHVLQRALANGAPGGWWWMSAFGAGFSCHGALLAAE
jgi:polyketide synthase Type III